MTYLSAKITHFFSRAVNYGFGIFFALIILISYISLFKQLINYSPLAIVGLVLLPIVCVALCLALKHLQNHFERLKGGERECDRIFVCMSICLLVTQIAFALCFDFTPRNDLAYICNAAESYVRYGADSIYNNLPARHSHYFAVYPNNHMLLMVIIALYKLEFVLTGDITNFLPIAINILGMNFSYALMYKIARLIYTPSKALICAVRGLMFTPLVTYAMYFYTDSMSMPWITLSIYLYVKWRRQNREEVPKKNRVITFMLFSVVLAIAYKMKGSTLLILPAVFIDMLISQKRVRDKLLSIVGCVIIFSAGCAIISNSACSMLNICDEELDAYRFPSIHWVMMSADGDGGYECEDFEYTKSFNGYDAKVSADVKRLEQKLEAEGPRGFFLHMILKLTYTWKSGSYMAGYYMENVSLLNGMSFYVLTAIFHFTLLFLMAGSFFRRMHNKEDAASEEFFLKTLLMLLVIFLMLWEARCRYAVSFFLLFALL